MAFRSAARLSLLKLGFMSAVFCAAPAGIALAQSADSAAAANYVSARSSILVTAQRRSENLVDVPMSITAYAAQEMDARGVRGIDDISLSTPGLEFTRSASNADNNSSNIAIRGVFSDIGAATTAIYIDDTPIQIRGIGYYNSNPYPRVFDLERVEVLRGPQGTLFGAGAMGGAVRFITPEPRFGDPEIYLRSEASSTEHGGESYETGIGGGGALSDQVSLRASAWIQKDGGYIDQINSTTGALISRDINSSKTQIARVALAFKPNDALTLTPSVYYQKSESAGRDLYWQEFSNLNNANYRSGLTNREPSEDEFLIAALKAQYVAGALTFISNTSYFDREQNQKIDYINYLSALRSGSPFGSYSDKDSANATASQTIDQRVFTQELRLQSTTQNSIFSGLAGVFYSRAEQSSGNFSESGRTPGALSLGSPQYLGRYNLFQDVHSADEQLAAFGSLDYRPVKRLTLTIGLRYTDSSFKLTDVRDGPVNGGFRSTDEAGQSASALTPRFSAAYKADNGVNFYASAARGFRLGGGQAPVDPTFCAADLAALGVTQTPRTFGPDKLWSYELGAKGSAAGGALNFDVNAWMIKWDDIQQAVQLPTCQFSYTENLGGATGKGLDIMFSIAPSAMFTLGASLGYGEITYDSNVTFGPTILRAKGERTNGPLWKGAFYALAERPVTNAIDGYIRLDYNFQSSGPQQNPATFSYDFGLPPLSGSQRLSARAGARFSKTDLSLFVSNLTNSSGQLSRSHDANYVTSLYYANSYRPRTIGLTLTYRR